MSTERVSVARRAQDIFARLATIQYDVKILLSEFAELYEKLEANAQDSMRELSAADALNAEQAEKIRELEATLHAHEKSLGYGERDGRGQDFEDIPYDR